MASSPSIHVLAADLLTGGHHGQQARQTAQAILRFTPPTIRLTLAVAPQLVEQQPALLALAERYPKRFRLHRASAPPSPEGAHVWIRNVRGGAAHAARFATLAREVEADHLFLPYLDTIWHVLGARRADLPVPISGMLFHPGFYYPPPSLRTSVWQWGAGWVSKGQKTLASWSAVRHPALRALCCMDPYAVPTLRRWAPRTHIDAVPDGTAYTAPSPRAVAETLAAWNIEPGRRAWLCFGVLNERKGVYLVLDALRLLPEDAQRKLAVVLVGRPDDPDHLMAAVEAARRASTVQIVTRFGFIPEDTIEPTIAAADGVLAPYVRHAGSSGLLIRAAQAARPSIGPEFGLMGRYVRDHRLGLAVPTEGPGAPAALSRALARAVEAPETLPFVPARAARYAAHHTPDRFGRVVASTLLHGLGLRAEARAVRAAMDETAPEMLPAPSSA